MAKITKKMWPAYFAKARAWKAHARLADFAVKRGDTIIFAEWDPRTRRYTGRKFSRKVKVVSKVPIAKFYTPKELKRRGLQIIEVS
mgnify:CR=1 FL=1